ncbi:unnamed protein product, partial [Prorocentrum cordatum]
VLMVPNAPMHKMSILEVHLSHVPDVSSGNVLIPNSASLTAEGGYLNPAFYVNIVVKKRGNPDSDNLCDNLAFKVSSTGWLVGTCNLFAAPLQDVIVTLRVKDYWSGQWLTNDDTMVENRVFYRQPLFTGLYDELGLSSGSTSIEDFQGVPANAIDLGCVLNRSTPQLLLLGSDLPDRSSLEMNGAILSDYYVSIELDGTDMGSFCKAISWNGETNLTCELARCINVSVLPRMPDLRMYLGDLRSATPATEKFASPRPEIYSFGPSFIEDVGVRNLWFEGRHFGEPECKGAGLHPDGTQLLGDVAITVGEYAVPCHVTLHNNTRVECTIDEPVMADRDLSQQISSVTGLYPPRRTAYQPVTFRLGCCLPMSNGDDSLLGDDAHAGTRIVSTDGVPLSVVEYLVLLKDCPSGQVRDPSDPVACVKCEPGRFVTDDEIEAPLRCMPCARGRYQGGSGASSCAQCPANTDSPEGSVSVLACTCLPGYFSEYLNG